MEAESTISDWIKLEDEVAAQRARASLMRRVSSARDQSMHNLTEASAVNIHVKYPRLRTSALVHSTQRMLGKLRSLEEMPDHPSVIVEVSGWLQVSETSAEFQEVFNEEVMGDFQGLGKRKEEDLTPPQAADSPRSSRSYPLLQLDQGTPVLQGVDV